VSCVPEKANHARSCLSGSQLRVAFAADGNDMLTVWKLRALRAFCALAPAYARRRGALTTGEGDGHPSDTLPEGPSAGCGPALSTL